MNITWFFTKFHTDGHLSCFQRFIFANKALDNVPGISSYVNVVTWLFWYSESNLATNFQHPMCTGLGQHWN